MRIDPCIATITSTRTSLLHPIGGKENRQRPHQRNIPEPSYAGNQERQRARAQKHRKGDDRRKPKRVGQGQNLNQAWRAREAVDEADGGDQAQLETGGE